MNQEHETIVLRPSRLKWVAYLLVFVPLFIIILWVLMDEFDFRVLILFLFILVVSIAGMVRLFAPGQLRINEIGFTAELMNNYMSYRWDEISEFAFTDEFAGRSTRREVSFADIDDAHILPDLSVYRPGNSRRF